MKSEDLLKYMNEIDEAYILEADPSAPSRTASLRLISMWGVRICAAAAAVFLILFAVRSAPKLQTGGSLTTLEMNSAGENAAAPPSIGEAKEAAGFAPLKEEAREKAGEEAEAYEAYEMAGAEAYEAYEAEEAYEADEVYEADEANDTYKADETHEAYRADEAYSMAQENDVQPDAGEAAEVHAVPEEEAHEAAGAHDTADARSFPPELAAGILLAAAAAVFALIRLILKR